MRVLVACEFSGIVRDAFAARGHNAWSCDFLPSERPGQHLFCDVRSVLGEGWDLLIAFPPCQYLAVSGARWFSAPGRKEKQEAALEFVRLLLDAPVSRIALENPVGIISTRIRKPDQIIQPYQFGHTVQKKTCLWLKNLPLLVPTKVVARGLVYVDPRGYSHGGVFTMRAKRAYSSLMLLPNSPERWKIRSRTFPGVADAMAAQWGGKGEER